MSRPDHTAPLVAVIAAKIQSSPRGQIPFAEYMAEALYHPQHGYYASQTQTVGFRGDFITSPHLGSDFGQLLAVQLADCWQRLEQPDPFDLVEVGPGQGVLAQQILHHLQTQFPDCFAASRYTLVEISPVLTAAQQRRLSPLMAAGAAIQWQSLDQIPLDSLIGCVFSNELIDALPVHLVEVTESGLQECYVALDYGPDGSVQGFCDRIAPLSTPRLTQYFQDLGLALTPETYPLGYRTEVNLAAQDWLHDVAQRLQQGYVMTIDYGYPAHRYYSPVRTQGTLQAYSRHAHHNDPYAYIGQQDLTAHVNFTALEQWGEQVGLKKVGFIPQGLFLMALGLGDRIAALSDPNQTDLQQVIQRRDALHQLMNPMGLGNFGVLIQAKGIGEESPPLKGLTVPGP
jgi:SAM-dependent MidA family methyltransferase